MLQRSSVTLDVCMGTGLHFIFGGGMFALSAPCASSSGHVLGNWPPWVDGFAKGRGRLTTVGGVGGLVGAVQVFEEPPHVPDSLRDVARNLQDGVDVLPCTPSVDARAAPQAEPRGGGYNVKWL